MIQNRPSQRRNDLNCSMFIFYLDIIDSNNLAFELLSKCVFLRKYAELPEVQRRREEERRQAEYRSYRLNAQLFNKVWLKGSGGGVTHESPDTVILTVVF